MPGAQEKARVVVLTDIDNEPDDEESLVRFLVYSNEYDVEALIATTSTHLETGPREDLIRRQLAAYEMVRPNLLKHAPGFPDATYLRSVTRTGQTTYGQAAVGVGRATMGSNLIRDVVDKPDPRPVWLSIWGGANTLAQTLTDVRATRTAAELNRFVAKIRVYSISDQDTSGSWLRAQFPNLSYIVTPSNQGATHYRIATWSGISGDRTYMNGPHYQFELVDNPWLRVNIIENHGPLGALYPPLRYIMEGDTPAFLGLIDNGLGWAVSPSYGGWGGRYINMKPAAEPRAIWTNNNGASRDTVTYAPGMTATSDMATIWRWRDHYQYDFAARMDWCVAPNFVDANHNPKPTLNGDSTKQVLNIAARGGTTVALNATGTTDPDGHTVTLKWFVYPEAGTISAPAALSATTGNQTELRVPAVTASGTIHVILQAEDNGTPHLFAYRRAVINVTP